MNIPKTTRMTVPRVSSNGLSSTGLVRLFLLLSVMGILMKKCTGIGIKNKL
jgi:hypothetical protein